MPRAPTIVHRLSPTGGRRVTLRRRILGIAYDGEGLVPLLQRAGIPDAVMLPDDPSRTYCRGAVRISGQTLVARGRNQTLVARGRKEKSGRCGRARKPGGHRQWRRRARQALVGERRSAREDGRRSVE